MLEQLRYLIAEQLIAWALALMPEGRQRLSLAAWIADNWPPVP